MVKFKDLKKSYDEELQQKKINNSLLKEAEELFSKAIYASNDEEAIKFALEAYELYPMNYQYKTFVISKEKDLVIKLHTYKELIEEINNYIESSKISLMSFYEENEIDLRRYCNLLYDYIVCLIENKKYDLAIEEINSFINKYGKYEYKVFHLLLNCYLAQEKYEKIVSLYDEESCEDVIILIPVSVAYLELKQYKYFITIKNRIMAINNNFLSLINNINDNETKYYNSRNRYLIGSNEEIFYALKYFYNYYKENVNYIKALQTSI